MAKKIKPIPGFPETEPATEEPSVFEAPSAPSPTLPPGFYLTVSEAAMCVEALDGHFTLRVRQEGAKAEPLKIRADDLAAQLSAYVSAGQVE